MRESSLGDCDEARELLPRMAAIDATFLQDKDFGAINKISMEKLSRSAYGVVMAYKEVRKLGDWKKPGSAPKAWSSKVDKEMLRRYDPAHSDDHTFVNRKVEDEVRSEMDRDAALLKARQNLEERRKDTS